MAPRELKVPKETKKTQLAVVTTSTNRKPHTAVTTTINKAISSRKNIEKTQLKVNNLAETRKRTNTVPRPATPKTTGSIPQPSTATKSARKIKRRPKPAHSGVPVPEKMKRLFQEELNNSDFTNF